MNTSLIIGEQNSCLTLPDGSSHSINIGTETTGKLLCQIPPNDLQWETAIATVEDAIAPFNKLLPTNSMLWLPSNIFFTKLFGNKQIIAREEIEQIFQQVSRYGFSDSISAELPIYANLLIMREWMHHMNFNEAHLGTPNNANFND